MTNTETCDVAATVAQIQRCVDAGADIMRVSVPTMAAAAAFGEIRKQVNVPLVADIHFDYKIALAVADLGADCLRINPGNIGSEAKFVKSWPQHVITTFPCESVSMPAHWKKIFKRNMASRLVRHCLNLRCAISIF